jgi:hypothetical protein
MTPMLTAPRGAIPSRGLSMLPDAPWLPCSRCGHVELDQLCTCLPYRDPKQRHVMEARVTARHREARRRWRANQPRVRTRRAAA